MTKRNRTDVRKEEILAAALEIAKKSGLSAVSGNKIAVVLGITRNAIHYHIASMQDLRQEVMRQAIEQEILEIIAQGLAVGDMTAQAAPEGLRRRAAESLV